LHVNSPIFITIKFEESGSAEEMAELKRQLRSNSKEGIVVESFFIVMGR
jgi:hypothetical protein